MSGFIKLHRKLLDWEWYTDANTRSVFIHCLLRANHKNKSWRGIKIARGSFLSSYEKLASELGLTRQQIRTSIKRLKSTNEITTHSNAQHTVFIINNYHEYQSSTNELTNSQPTANQQLTTNKNEKNEKNINTNGEFERVWELYGRKGNKKTSRAKWGRLSNEVQEKIFNHVPVYVLATPEKQYRKNFETYLNQEVWNDEVITNGSHQQHNQPRPSAVDRVKANTAGRAAERASRGLNGQGLGEDGGDVRLQVCEPIRGDAGQYMGELLEGDYSKADS